MSGRELQMQAMARALISNSKVLLMDELSMELSPVLVDQQFELIEKVNGQAGYGHLHGGAGC